ncbi:AraC family transcriptional regulator of adaptative response / methylphosphotriester-DNA alkyltransferase methyltransferase [Bacillus oleivorans]|uniref:AraC family transcriptional regulator of adaptative response / methylphosphotriester-DNA alkyltransferase methyltransferase n=1 Tax=Bacillus oleivorans TaxID=1448271 RepID=A0A285CLP2_9BACI|nr:bifunctional transcriptional activator/DNA repair enzyme AdaA [Bacillus oleivorans]SNX68489.1 AraC family transcriptional regulator of adaptative response / methylphosphotriester-DNA alkyltransferase methyltransferase [Bacillus oleivorans]
MIGLNNKPVSGIPDEKWAAIINNDTFYDDVFIYAVKTTRIFCRPSCKSRTPNKENVQIFENPSQAMAAGFRPCKRCNPLGQTPSEEWVTQMTDYMANNFSKAITLHTLADIFQGSPFHLHRTFRRITGKTPVAFLHQIRITKSKEYLLNTHRTIAEISTLVGLPNTSYFITLFKKKTGLTPTDYRKKYQSPKE